MSWAARRRATILGGIMVILLAIIALILYLSLHQAPSCHDHIQDEGEAGIDCGGPCPYLCASQVSAPVVSFTQAFAGLGSTTDAIAYVSNPNQAALATNVSYTLSLYSANSDLVAEPTGTLSLAPGATTPVFFPNIPTGNAEVAHAFLSIDPSSLEWQESGAIPIPSVGSPVIGGTARSPQITATLSNPAAEPLQNVVVVVALFDASGNVITASQTLLPLIPAQGSAQAVFTWNAPFSEKPARIDVLPLPQVP